MKKGLLFSLMATFLAGIGFGGVSFAIGVESNCSGIDTTAGGIITVSTAEDLEKGLQCSEVREIKLNANIEIQNNIISTNNENLKLNLGTYKVTAADVNYIIELYGKYEIIGEEGSDFIVRYIDVYGYENVAGELIITSGTFHTNMYPNDDTTIKIDGGNIYGRLMSYGSDSKIIINDGIIRNDKGDGIDMTNGGYLEVNGGTIESTYDNPNENESDGDAILLSYSATYGAPECVINGGTVRGLFDGITIFGNGTENSALLTINGGLIEGQNAGVSGNGSDTDTPSETTKYGGTKIVINDGKIVGNTAIYHPQYGVLTVEGGEIEGVEEAIEMRAGELNISGGKFTATTDVCPANVTPNGNGSTTVGAAIAIAQHSTKKAITVNISGGEFNACAAVNQSFPQAHTEEDEAKVSTTITNGIFTGVVARSGDDSILTIQGGIFSEKPDINYISDGYSVYKNNDSKYVVTTIEAAEQGATEATVAPDPIVAAETTFTTETTEDFSAAVPAEDSSKVSVVEQKLPDVAGDGATYTLVVDTEEVINVESGDTTTTMTGVKESELRSSADKTPEIKGGAEVYIQKADGTSTGRNVESVGFTKPVAIPISIGTDMAGKTVFVKVKHEMGESFGIDGLSNNGTSCTQVTSAPSLTVGANGYIIVYTCKASTFVAYTETGTTSSSTPSSNTSGGGGGGGGSSSSYSCKSLPANAVANNTSKPKKDTNYSYSTDTGVVCTFQCKTGYTRNEKDEKCEKSSEDTVGTDKEGTEKVDTTDTSDTAFEDLRKVLDDGYTVEFHNAYNFAFKNGITTMPNIQAADMNSPLTRIAMAKMLSQYAINVLKKTPDTTKTISFPDVSAELDAQYNNGVTLAYQLGIMGVNIENFRPDDLVTRAEFVTALSRMLFGLADGENLYYETHMQKLLDENIITVDNPNMHELRGYVMIMLMRSVKNN